MNLGTEHASLGKVGRVTNVGSGGGAGDEGTKAGGPSVVEEAKGVGDTEVDPVHVPSDLLASGLQRGVASHCKWNKEQRHGDNCSEDDNLA